MEVRERVVCKGSFLLGTACQTCERCAGEFKRLFGDLEALGYRVAVSSRGDAEGFAAAKGTSWREFAPSRYMAWTLCRRHANDHPPAETVDTSDIPEASADWFARAHRVTDPLAELDDKIASQASPRWDNLTSGLLDMVRRGVLSAENCPDDFDWLREVLGPGEVASAMADGQEEDAYDQLAKAAREVVSAIRAIDVMAGSAPMTATSHERSTLYRLAGDLERALEIYGDLPVVGQTWEALALDLLDAAGPLAITRQGETVLSVQDSLEATFRDLLVRERLTPPRP